MNKDEALQIASEALTDFDYDKRMSAIESIKQALETKDAPVAWEQFHEHMAGPNYVAPKSTWVGLTEEDLKPICDEWRIVYGAWMHDFARDIEAKLKEKNT